jgi:hypothetical protein
VGGHDVYLVVKINYVLRCCSVNRIIDDSKARYALTDTIASRLQAADIIEEVSGLAFAILTLGGGGVQLSRQQPGESY